MNLLKLLAGIVTGNAGAQIGGAVSRVAQLGALLAVLAPLWLWLQANGDDVFYRLELTYKDLLFWGVIFGGFLFVIVRLVHRAPPPWVDRG